MLSCRSTPSFFVALALLSPAVAQATYVNFETPQVKPIAMATVGNVELLLVCNTPDSSVEIYDPNTALPATPPVFLARVPVGQGPASVRFDPVSACFYTANYIGDSVTKVQLAIPGGVLQWSLVATKPAGESPADVAISADGATLFVTLADASRLATLNAATLDPIGGPVTMTVPHPDGTMAVKEPRRIEIKNGARWILNMKGGNQHKPHTASATYDLDLWTFDPATSTTRFADRLGTTNAGMAFGVNGRLYVVGSMARNEIADEPQVKDLAVNGTGFVESWLWVVDPNGAAPSAVDDRNLNLNAAGNVVTPARACSQPMDVVLLQGQTTVDKIYIAAFGSDRLVVLIPNGGDASTWPRTVVDLPIVPQPNDYGRNGPRGLAVNGAQTRLYCMNLLSNSVSVVDLTTDTEAVRFPLQWDITPRLVREGRRFLYSDEFSARGTVACSSCHVDARSDSLGWDLGTPNDPPVPIPVGLEDVIQDPTSPGNFDADKGIMVTQSLQGLVNHPLNVAGQDFVSNKPYHWRGDRADFLAFNGAFVNLMGAGGPLRADEMIVYRDFINTVMYTPNPEQAPTRVHRGDFGDANELNSGDGAMRGLKVFHFEPQVRCGGRSCVQCHFLPESSNNRITEPSVGGLETAAMRSLFQREGRVEGTALENTVGESDAMTSHFGLAHEGRTHAPHASNPIQVSPGPASIDRFVLDSFGGFQTDGLRFERFQDLVRFCREFDAGIAPGVGVTHTVTFANQALPTTTAAFDLLEQQVRAANVGLAVHARINGTMTGFWYDLTAQNVGYHEHGTANVLSRTDLLALIGAADVLVLQGTPVGSERRLASTTGHPMATTGPAPQNIALQPLRPPTHWALVPQMTKNWDPLDLNNGFVWNPNPPAPQPQSLKSVRLLQRGLIQFGPGLGLTSLRHEAPRRFAVTGDDIRLGARLQLRVPTPGGVGPPPPPYTDLAADTTLMEMGLHPTDQFAGNRRVWETTVEVDPLVAYVLLLGGPKAPGVAPALERPDLIDETLPLPPSRFDPQNWNSFHVTVVNEDNTASPGTWLQLTIQ